MLLYYIYKNLYDEICNGPYITSLSHAHSFKQATRTPSDETHSRARKISEDKCISEQDTSILFWCYPSFLPT